MRATQPGNIEARRQNREMAHAQVLAALSDPATVKSFTRRIAAPNALGCMLWTGEITDALYGVFRIAKPGGKKSLKVRAHRFAFAIANGFMPSEDVLHSCDRRICCNPRHLRIGNRADNARDMVQRGRSKKGVRSPMSKLTDDSVREIRRRREDGQTVASLAAAFNVDPKTIRDAVSRSTWRHVAAPSRAPVREPSGHIATCS